MDACEKGEATRRTSIDTQLPEECVSTSQPSTPNKPTPLADSDSGCSCCLSSDNESKLTQRRSLSVGTSPKLRDKHGEISNAPGSKIMQERILWAILLLACTALLFSLAPLRGSSGFLDGLSAASGRLVDSLTPQGPLLWQIRWRVKGKLDPRPLWDTDMLGSRTDWPHGSTRAFATAMGAGTTNNVAVVGNGPISDAQRQEIAAADRVVRFNAMNNRRSDERVDVWVVRHNLIPPYMFWGFQQLQDVEIENIIHEAKAVLFLGGSSQHNASEMIEAVERVLFWFPDMQPSQIQQVNFTSYWDVYNKVLAGNASVTIESGKTMPSSGLLGLLAVLAAVGDKVRVDLYGFNWSIRSYVAHKMSAEELIIQAVQRKYQNMHVHPTACEGLYSCDALCDTNQFRLAVDEANCRKQVEKAKHGKPARFIDQHSIENLDWHPELKEELKLPAHLQSDAERLAWLQSAAWGIQNIGEGAPSPEVPLSPQDTEVTEETAAAPQGAHDRHAASTSRANSGHVAVHHFDRKSLKKAP